MCEGAQVSCRAYSAWIIRGIEPQPFRAGLTFGGRPSGPCIHGDLAVSLLPLLATGKSAPRDDKIKGSYLLEDSLLGWTKPQVSCSGIPPERYLRFRQLCGQAAGSGCF